MMEWIVTSSVLLAVLIILRYVLRGKISLRLQYALWGLALLRLLIPFSVGGTSFSVLNAVERVSQLQSVEDTTDNGQMQNTPSGQTGVAPNIGGDDSHFDFTDHTPADNTNNVTAPAGTGSGTVTGMAQTGPVSNGTPAEPDQTPAPVKNGPTLSQVLFAVWGSGAVLLLVFFAISNGRFAHRLRRSRRELAELQTDEGLPVYLTDAADTPCLFGLIQPAIYVTPEAASDPTTLRHTLAHETTHFLHGDSIWPVLRVLCLAIHWYNPLVWWAAVLSRNDAELACDEGTVKRIGEEERAEYGRTLIRMTCQKRPAMLLAATTMTGGKRGIKERITLLVKKPKMAVYTLVAVVLATALLVGGTFTGAAKDTAEGEDSPPQEELTDPAGMKRDEGVLAVQVGSIRYQVSFWLDIPEEIEIINFEFADSHEYWDGVPKGILAWTLELPEGAQALDDGTWVRSGLGFYDGSLDTQIVPAGVTYREWYYPIADGAFYLCFRWDETDLETAEAVRATLGYSEDWSAIPHPVAGYESTMSQEDWKALNGFFPVLNGETTFHWLSLDSDGVSKEMQEVTWEEFPAVYWGESYREWEVALGLDSFALCDIDGEGEKELILCITPGASAYYLILHREGTEFYGVCFWSRLFEDLQQNGIFGASGGGTQYYYQLHFRDGGFERELLGCMLLGGEMIRADYYIAGETVDEATFNAWRDELMVGDVTWFPCLLGNGTSAEGNEPGQPGMTAQPEQTATQAVLDVVDVVFENHDAGMQCFVFPATGPALLDVSGYYEEVRGLFAQYTWTQQEEGPIGGWDLFLQPYSLRYNIGLLSGNPCIAIMESREDGSHMTYYRAEGAEELVRSLMGIWDGPELRLALVRLPESLSGDKAFADTLVEPFGDLYLDSVTIALADAYAEAFGDLYLNSGAITDFELRDLEYLPRPDEYTYPMFTMTFAVRPADPDAPCWSFYPPAENGWVTFSFGITLTSSEDGWRCSWYQ